MSHFRLASALVVLVWLIAISVASAQTATDPPSDDDLSDFENALAADKEAMTKESTSSPNPAEPVVRAVASAAPSMNPNISIIMDAAAAYFSEDEPLQAGGHDPNKTGFTLQQVELHADANVDHVFKFDANIVFTQFGVEVEEAYATTLSLPANLQVRAGQFLNRFGRLNATHPHAWQFLDQPIVNGKFFGGEGSRGVGAEVSYLAPLPWYTEIIGATMGSDGECCSRSFYGADDKGIDDHRDLLYSTALKQFFPMGSDWSLMLGASGQFGPNPTGQGNRSEIYGADVYLRYRPVTSQQRSALSLHSEGMFRTRQVPDDVLQDWGSFTQLVWNINPSWETGVRYEYVTGVEDDYLDPDWTEDRDRVSYQWTYYPSHFSRVRLQGSRDDPKWLDKPTYAVMLGLEVLVGAHGAHSY
ncbi:MAG: zinc-regulated TonB-dependent outer membrane receptor [Deltaproteobacteria bacterium]|nr:zinc-regulated TonB-dependent outer membrane receptor [Deltaproteobacteria bacterium]